MWGSLLAKRSNLSPYVEVLLFIAVYIAIGFFLESNDPILVKTDPVFLTLFLTILTLYYGTEKGLLAISVFALVHFVHADLFLYKLFLKELILVFVLGEFHNYWRHTLESCNDKSVLLESKLNELGTAYYALKVSHDQLELNYVLRPISLRRVLTQIVEGTKESEKEYEKLMLLLMKTFNINRLLICQVENGKLTPQVWSDGAHREKVLSDPLAQKMLEDAAPVYISKHVGMKTPFIAAIPALDEENRVKAAILIEDMPFMSFQEDNMISIFFFFEYFYLTLNRHNFLENVIYMQRFDAEFRFEFLRLYRLYERFGIDSAVIAFKTESELASHLLNEQVVRMERGLDVHGSAKVGECYITLVLTVFSIPSSADVLRKRILSGVEPEYASKIKDAIFTVSKKEILTEYIGCDNVSDA